MFCSIYNVLIDMVGIIIVLYNPNNSHIQSLEKLKDAQNQCLITVVDNTSKSNDRLELIKSDYFVYTPLLRNTGIAYAQNVGINECINRKCSHIVFFDQDSIIPNNYLRNIVEEYDRIENQCPELFLLGPTAYNLESKEEYMSVIHKKNGYKGVEDFYYQRDVISSGSCVRASKISDVGLMDDMLFIDAVDFEWCWRAQKKGFLTGITPNVTLDHKVGQKELRFPFGYKVIISAPIRYFYQYRNYIWLLKRSYVPDSWKVNTGIKLVARLFYFPFVVKNGLTIEKNMWKGILAGLSKINI